MVIPSWVLDPFANADTADSSNLEMELLELTTNEELKIKFRNGYQELWLQKTIPAQYPQLWAIVQLFLKGYSSSYLVELGLSAISSLLSKKRSRLNITERGDFRLMLTKWEPDIDQLLNIN